MSFMFKTAFVLIVVAGLIIAGYFGATVESKVIEKSEEITSGSMEESSDNIPEPEELHWESMPVTYQIMNEKECGSHQTKRIRKAFEKIEKETEGVIDFEEGNDAEITVNCNKGFNIEYLNSDGTVIQAEATYFNEGNKIKKARVEFYDTKEGKIASNCGAYPDTEVHEILHTFGFEHVEDRYHIMNAVGTYCPTKINKDVVEKLQKRYSKAHKV